MFRIILGYPWDGLRIGLWHDFNCSGCNLLEQPQFIYDLNWVVYAPAAFIYWFCLGSNELILVKEVKL